MDQSQFDNEYDLQHLELITPQKHSFKMWITPRFHSHYEANTYEELTSDLIVNLTQGIDLFVDVGAHYGYFSLLAGQANPNCEIIAFEPVPENYEILKRNFELNQLKNAKAMNQAVSNKNSLGGFNISTASDNCALVIHPATPTLKQIDVQIVTLAELLSNKMESRILVKIDSEGNELQILDGIKEYLEENNNVQLILEFNPECLLLNGTKPEELLSMLHLLGYKVYFLNDEDHQYFQPPDNGIKTWKAILGKKTYLNIYCAKNDLSTNLLFFSHSSQLAGAERSLLELCKELIADYNCMCTVVLPSHGPLEAALNEKGVSTLIGQIKWWCKGAPPPTEFEVQSGYSESYEWVINNRQLFDRINPDVILTNTMVIPWGAIVASLIKRPHVWMVREYGEADHKLKFFLPLGKILEFIDESSDVITVNSKDVQNVLFPFPKTKKIKTIYYFIQDPTKNKTLSVEKDFYSIPDGLHLVISGTVMESKGQEDAVRAVIELVKKRKCIVELIIAGYFDSEFKNRLDEIIKDEGVEKFIHFLPFMDNVFPLIQQADIVLVCSKKEAFGRVTLEAMLMNKPIIATDSGGTKEMIIDGKTGLLYSPGNYLQLADQIEELFKNNRLRVTLANNARKFATKHFTKENFGGKYFALIQELRDSKYQIKEKIAWFLSEQNELLMKTLLMKISDRDQKIQSLNMENVMFATSKSWRITRPIRKIVSLFRGRGK